jgi:hypothetical protein
MTTSPYTSNKFFKASFSTFEEHEGLSPLMWYKMLSLIYYLQICWSNLWRNEEGELERILTNNFEDFSPSTSSFHSSRASILVGLSLSVNRRATAKQTRVRMMRCAWKSSTATIVSLSLMSLAILCNSPCCPLPHSSPFIA